MSQKQKRMLYRIGFSVLMLVSAIACEISKIAMDETVIAAMYLTAYITVGYDVITKAVVGLRYRKFANENLLMAVASVGAVFLGEYTESVAVMLFYQVGELFQSYAIGKSRKNVAELMNIRPDTARVIRGEAQIVNAQNVSVGEIIEVRSGEKIALDGVIEEGSCSLDTSAMTGESLPLYVTKGDGVLAGCVNIDGILKIKVTIPFGESSVSKILELVENASMVKTQSEKFITRFARYYTPFVMAAAFLIACIPQFFTDNPLEWIRRALMFLVISCPCALLISVPLSFFGGIGAAASKGVLIKGSGYMETLTKCKTFVFDKTGTLTKGSFKVCRVNSELLDQKAFLGLCAAVEQYSSHPLAKAIVEAADGNFKKLLVDDVNVIAGQGICARVENRSVAVGNSRLMNSRGIFCEDKDQCTVHVAIGNAYAGSVILMDEIKEESPTAIKKLKALGIKETVMLTGDKPEIAQKIAELSGIDSVSASLLPQDKVYILERLKRRNTRVAYVGDGVNDAPVIKSADVGIAMGALGSDAAIAAADVVLMDDNPEKLALAVKISKRTCSIATQNIVIALLVKIIFLVFSALGVSGMLSAVFADVGVSVIAILNAMRTLNIK
ncbi:MAG: heavy metal translocating P-type ATPase [Acutalibacteraceae bacterium]|nr:heavy metal translocating P-type ATPase [Acutalibacteraceae bacterium]